jgi:DNA topoisomerase-3
LRPQSARSRGWTNDGYDQSLIIAEKPSVAQDIVRALTPEAKVDKHADHFENERYVVPRRWAIWWRSGPEAYDVKRGKWSSRTCRWCLRTSTWRRSTRPSRLNAVVKLVKRKDVSS